MHMFCFQCQETGEGKACTHGGECGKSEEVANLQDLLIYTLKGIGILSDALIGAGSAVDRTIGMFVCDALFTTVTNVNFDPDRLHTLIARGLEIKRGLRARAAETFKNSPGSPSIPDGSPLEADCVVWDSTDRAAIVTKSYQVGVLSTPDEDIRSLREMITYALKGMAAYTYHANILGYFDDAILAFIYRALAAVSREEALGELVALALEAGKVNIDAMALLDTANNETYGQTRVSTVPLGVRRNPGILISGHDLKDIEDLLTQTDGTGVDVYTHSEMIAAHYYPKLKQFSHLAGNYGNAWWNQEEDFATFNGPIIVTSNCITPVQPSYAGRIFTTGPAAYPGVRHIWRDERAQIDFGEVIALAKTCPPPTQIDTQIFTGGFGWRQLAEAAPKIVELVKSGRIRRFIVIAGCDGRDRSRVYYREVAERLPNDTIILTAGCAKYPFMKLNLGEIEGIPRIIDAGQCNDCYSLVRIALSLMEVFAAKSINDLPISFDIAWYDQKAVAVLLSLLYLGVKGIRLGPTLPGFLSPKVRAMLVEKYAIRLIGTSEGDVEAMMAGR
ncbi:MAG: hydroxylamine reductase [Candidatus Methylomirabilota bacterium]